MIKNMKRIMSSKIIITKIIIMIEILTKNIKIKILKNNNRTAKIKAQYIIKFKKMKKIKNIDKMLTKLNKKIFIKELRIKMKIQKSPINMEAIEIKSLIFKNIQITKDERAQNKIKIHNLSNRTKSSKTINKTTNFIKLRVRTNCKKQIKKSQANKRAQQT
jgi:hypothetical protein